MMSATTLSPFTRGFGLPHSFSAASFSSKMSTTLMPPSFSFAASSGLAGFTATPFWVTSTSMVLPGVDLQNTWSVTMGSLARDSGAMIIASLAPAAVSE